MALGQHEGGDERNSFQTLVADFESTFGDLIPGIIHDFASPLNGILGRSELLGRRMDKTIERIEGHRDIKDSNVLADYEKIRSDAGLLAKEADHLFELFNSVAGKFRRLKDETVQPINLSELLESEVVFLRFYPQIKYAIDIKLALDREIPEVTGVKSDYSVALSAVIKRAVDSMKDSESKQLFVNTGYNDSEVYVNIRDTGMPLTELQIKTMREQWNSSASNFDVLNGQRGFFHALYILKKYGATFQIAYESGLNSVLIRIPY